MSWTRNLIDIQLESGGLDLYVRVAHAEPDRGRNKTIIITIEVIVGTLVIVLCAYIMWRRTSKNSGNIPEMSSNYVFHLI
ncbi:putative non-specific serine/threonine protein kinase [Medicago truncatula]|uniref:Putative non-specific serine/threonine protein kinase n=1 Tax=Medicago truncatula TaxID=3880 RepID=A0A396GXU9_MEDTR|nr:putative non-specific serine/threonine protein kinase [Medicago truncatula]